MKCPRCGETLSSEGLNFCTFCGFQLDGGGSAPVRAEEEPRSERFDTPVSKNTAPPAVDPPSPVPMNSQPIPMQGTQQPQMGVMPGMMQPQMGTMPGMTQPQMGTMTGMAQPQMGAMNGMAQPQMGTMPGMAQPQMGTMPGMAQPQMGVMPGMMQPQMGVMPGMMQPQMGVMPGMMQPQMGMMGSVMPNQPVSQDAEGTMQGYAMPSAMYSAPQFAGYDASGNPVYMQMVPQVMGYDAYGNPMYTMVAVPCPPPMQNPAMMTMPAQAPATTIPAEAYVNEEPAEPVPAPPIERRLQVTDAGDIPLSAETLMNEPEHESEDIPDEEQLLEHIFSDEPKGYTMSEGTAPSEHVFSINVSASEITSAGDEQPPAEPKPRKQAAKPKTTPKEKKPAEKKTGTAAEKTTEKKSAPKKKAAPKKPPAKIVSPDEFFDDTAKKSSVQLKDIDNLDDEQLEEKLHADSESKRKSHSSRMKAATIEEMDFSNVPKELQDDGEPTVPTQ